jgi:flavin reductase (DIM6/NTAB) family NADH-FMN oxidoreductase RutF
MTMTMTSPAAYRAAPGHFASGVIVVTGSHDDGPGGLTCQTPGGTGSLRLAMSHAWIDCNIEAVHAAGDHLLAIGAVCDLAPGAGSPLLTYRGGFGHLNAAVPGMSKQKGR